MDVPSLLGVRLQLCLTEPQHPPVLRSWGTSFATPRTLSELTHSSPYPLPLPYSNTERVSGNRVVRTIKKATYNCTRRKVSHNGAEACVKGLYTVDTTTTGESYHNFNLILIIFLLGHLGHSAGTPLQTPKDLTAGRFTGLPALSRDGYSNQGLPYRTGLIVQDRAPLPPCQLGKPLAGIGPSLGCLVSPVSVGVSQFQNRVYTFSFSSFICLIF